MGISPVSVLLELALQLVVLVLFGLGLGTWTTRRLGLPAVYAPALVLASACLQGYLLFFAWFFSGAGAMHLTRAAFVISVVLAIGQRRKSSARVPWRDPALALAYMLLVSFAYLLILGATPTEPAGRFSVPLPNDDMLPRYLADRFYLENFRWDRPQPPLDGSFLASDRPPLQAALVLAVRSLTPSYRYATYQITGTICQTGWVLALYALCATWRTGRARRAFVLTATTCSGFALLNSVYVWPKLLAAWLFLAAIALALRDDGAPAGVKSERFVAAAALVALSLLAHGGTVFSLFTVPILLEWKNAPDRVRPRTLLMAALVGLALLSPWLAYQRWLDSPGDRLIKLHLAGVDAIDSRGAVAVIWERYMSTRPAELFSARLANLREQWLTPPGRRDGAIVPWVQFQQFFHLVPALGVLNVGLLALAVRRRSHPHDPRMRRMLLYALATWALWVLLMFAPHSALLHHGSYANALLLFVLGAYGLTLLPRMWSGALLGAHIALFVVGWLWIHEPPAPPRPAWLSLGIATLACATLLAWAPMEHERPQP